MGADGEQCLLGWSEAPSLGAAVAVTTRHGGVSEGPYDSLNLGLHVGDDADRVLTNRALAARRFGVALDTMVFAQQVHGAGAALVGVAERGRGTTGLDDAVPSADILVTAAAETTLVMLVADCVPLALIDPEARVLAAVHAGWRDRGRRRRPRAGRNGSPRSAGRPRVGLPGSRRASKQLPGRP